MKNATLAISCLLFGCATVRPIIRDTELVVYPRFVPHTQSVILPLSLSSIATLDIVPYVEVSQGVFSPISSTTGNATVPEDPNVLKLSQASPSIDPNRPFVLRRLKPNNKYRVYGKAYNASNALISLDTSSYTEVNVGSNDAPTMATLPVNLIDTPFGASTSVTINTDGRFDYLKTTLYLVSNNSQVALSQTIRNNPTINFANLQNNTSYKLVAEAYKLGGVMASNSLNLTITNDTTPATTSLALNVPYVVTTVAGNGVNTFVDGTGTSASFNYPNGVAADALGNLYEADTNNYRIRKIDTSGVVTTVAGNGVASFADGPGNSASFSDPAGVAVDILGNLFVADYSNHRIRKIDTNKAVTTVAGNGVGTFADGSGNSASFSHPASITVDTLGNLYVADTSNHRIRKIDTNKVVTTVAGNGVATFANGTGTSASFNYPYGVAVDGQGNLYVADTNNSRIRKIDTSGVVTTIAGNGVAAFADGTGTSASFNFPRRVAVDGQGNLFVADTNNNRIRKITPSGVVTTVAGNGNSSFVNGTGTSATFSTPYGIAVDALGNIFVGDSLNYSVRRLQ